MVMGFNGFIDSIPGQSYAQYKAQQIALRNAEAEAKAAQEQQAREAQLRPALSQYGNAASPEQRQASLRQIMEMDPNIGFRLQEQEASRQQKESEQQAQRQNEFSRYFYGVRSPEEYNYRRQMAAQRFAPDELDDLPEQYDENIMRTFDAVVDAMSVKDGRSLSQDRAMKAFEADQRIREGDADFSRDVRLEGVRTANERGLISARGAEERRTKSTPSYSDLNPQSGMAPKDARKATTDLRKEFNNLPAVKAFNDVRGSYQVISDIAKNPSEQNDIALIFSYMKMLDPGSVVREGEFANAQNTAGIPDRVRNAYNKALSGKRLNPEQISGFVKSARSVYVARRQEYNRLAKEYQDYAKSYGVDAGQVAREFKDIQQPKNDVSRLKAKYGLD